MNLNQFDTRIATRDAGVTARGATRPWGFGNIAPGPCLPHGSAHPGPNTDRGRSNGYDPTRPIRGFAQIHVSGTGSSGKYGNFLLAPQLGLAVGEEAHDSPKADEIATPAYYAVTLTRYGIRVELTATHCCALYRITFPESREACLAFDLGHNIPGDVTRGGGWPVAGSVAWEAAGRRLAGSGRYRGGWGPAEYQAHGVAEISAAPAAFGTWHNGAVGESADVAALERDRIGAWWRKPTRAGEQVLVKFGVSVRDQASAAAHLARELPGWDFDAVRAAAESEWQRALGVIEVGGDSRYFHMALRNAMLMPRDRSAEHGGPHWDEFYCSWDIFRTVMPLMTLVKPAMVRGCLASLVDRLDRGGLVTDAFINGQDLIGGMGGEMVDVIIADAVAKDLPGLDVPAVYRVLRQHAEQGRCPVYRERGWIPCDRTEATETSRVWCPSSTSLEMNYTDWCAAQVAAKLGLETDAERYRARGRNWRHLFNPNLESAGFRGFMSARQSDGAWRDDLAWTDNKAFAEETTWEYTHFVPHELPALIKMCGGPEAWVRRVEHSLAVEKIRLDNEPTFLLIHSLSYAGRPDLTTHWTRRFLADWYEEDAYPGPDDSGAMAAWYVFGCLGLFPNAGQDLYLLHAPQFPSAVIHLAEGRDLEIRRHGDKSCIGSAQWNGKPLDRCWLRHGEIAAGGVLEFLMTDEAGDWGRKGCL